MLNRDECGFTYRHSIFNTSLKGRYVILAVNLRLAIEGRPNLGYKDVQNYFGDRVPTQQEVRKAIIEIRKSKGQDPDEYWSAGSFFSNFKLTQEEFENLCAKISEDYGAEREKELRDLVKRIAAPSDGGMIKVTSSWILDQLLGLKGYVHNERVRLSPLHVLNLVNTGGASAADALDLYEYVRKLTREKAGLELVNEPEFVGF